VKHVLLVLKGLFAVFFEGKAGMVEGKEGQA